MRHLIKRAGSKGRIAQSDPLAARPSRPDVDALARDRGEEEDDVLEAVEAVSETTATAAPAVSTTRHSLGARVSALAPKETRRRTCLLVDDSRMIRKIARPIVEACGFAVSEAENGEEALAKCRIAMPDLVLLDWDMPVMTGIQFLDALREQDGGDAPKVVFCTSKSAGRDMDRARSSGADEYITKPFDQTGLLEKLKLIGVV